MLVSQFSQLKKTNEHYLIEKKCLKQNDTQILLSLVLKSFVKFQMKYWFSSLYYC